MGAKLSKAPVYYVVAQAQFNPILDLDSFLPGIQAQMREANFPDFRQEVAQRLVFPMGVPDAAQQPAPALSRQTRYFFGDVDGRTSFLLDTSSLSLQTTAYDTFETFARMFLACLEILHKSLRLAYVERIGLRYLDAIYPLETEGRLNAYLVPEVLGLSHKLDGQLAHSVSETVRLMTAGQLVSRVIIREGRVGFPEELAVLPLDPRFAQWEKLHAIVDSDAFHSQREAFNVAAVEARLVSLHDLIEHSFKTTVTDHARAAWA